MHPTRLEKALDRLIAAIRDVETELAAMKADTKSGKRRETKAQLSFNTACELGFRGSLNEWDRLMGAVARRYLSFSFCADSPVRALGVVRPVVGSQSVAALGSMRHALPPSFRYANAITVWPRLFGSSFGDSALRNPNI
jgi:hypothetical protein